jgi:hypothetical protein
MQKPHQQYGDLALGRCLSEPSFAIDTRLNVRDWLGSGQAGYQVKTREVVVPFRRGYSVSRRRQSRHSLA